MMLYLLVFLAGAWFAIVFYGILCKRFSPRSQKQQINVYLADGMSPTEVEAAVFAAIERGHKAIEL